MSDDPIDAYLATLERRVRGRPDRDRLLTETEDHLRESAGDLESSGMSPAAAAREAVRRMGAPEPLGTAAGGRVAAAVVLALGWLGAIGLIAAAAAVSGPGQDGPSPGFPLLLLVGAMAAGVVSFLAAAAVRSWASAIASTDAALRHAMAAFAAAAAFALVGLGVHVGKHQSGGTMAAREERALFCLAVAAAVLLVALAWIELNACEERRKRSGPPAR
ncbi:MAG TPA: permease prefix domain 1-containing protein [Gaiellales bacterium]|nr:permease prefix domain 1-containing protein [Gaiellales bacterium]